MELARQAITIAREAGALLQAGLRGRKEIEHKSSPIDLVTQYDRQSEALIVSRLRQAFPEHGVLAEEGQRRSAKLVWYIDPLDGTINFTHGFPHFAVSMALYEQNEPLAAVTYDPVKDECFWAARGEGSFLEGPRREPERLRVTSRENLLECLLATGFPYDRHTSAEDNVAQFRAFLKKVRGIRRAGSATLDLAYVAAGRFDGFWEFKLGPWDVAAGVLLVREAGGTVTGPGGGPLELGPRMSLIASNGLVHGEMIEILQGCA